MTAISYSQIMGEQAGHLTLKLDTAEPIELGDFVGAFTSIANEFERHVLDTYPGVKADPRIYIREIRSGCVEADMITGVTAAAGIVITHLDQILILEDFVKRWGRRMTALITNKVPAGELETTAQLNDFYRATEAIASDPVAVHRLAAVAFEKDGPQVRVAFQFSAVEARTAQQNIDDRKKLLTRPESVPHRRVLMRYTRTDVHDAAINKRSGERVVIATISDRDLPIIYASEMVEQEIRGYIRESDENAYKRGFVVDAMVQMNGENAIAYAITALHSVIDVD